MNWIIENRLLCVFGLILLGSIINICFIKLFGGFSGWEDSAVNSVSFTAFFFMSGCIGIYLVLIGHHFLVTLWAPFIFSGFLEHVVRNEMNRRKLYGIKMLKI